jgi:hypothetical protein
MEILHFRHNLDDHHPRLLTCPPSVWRKHSSRGAQAFIPSSKSLPAGREGT